MNIDNWLTDNRHLNSETRISLEELVVSQEGFFDKAKDFIFGKLGKSMKGDDYKPVRLEHTYNFKATITAISRQYGDSMWLNRQNWNRDKIEGRDILPYLGDINPEDLRGVIMGAGSFCIVVHEQWLVAVSAYFRDLRPVVEVLKPGLNDETLVAAIKLLRKIPDISTYYKNPPRVFPVADRKIPKELKQVLAPAEQDHRYAPLNKVQTEMIVKSMIVQLERLCTLRDAFTRVAYEVVGPVSTRQLIQLSHSGTPKIPKDSKRKLEDWVYLSTRLDPVHMYWGSEEFAIVRRFYGDAILATCRWVDRSIR